MRTTDSSCGYGPAVCFFVLVFYNRELFEGLVDILPDADKKREMLVLLSASRAVQAKKELTAAAKKDKKDAVNKNKKGPPPSTTSSISDKRAKDDTAAVPDALPSDANVSTVNGTATDPSRSPSHANWPGLGGSPSPSGEEQNGTANVSRKTKANSSTAGGGARGAKKNTQVAATPAPGSAATWLKAMNKTGGGGGGKTGISVVRTSRGTGGGGGGGGASKSSNSLSSLADTGGSGRARSESPPPGVPMRRRADDDDAYTGGRIQDAGASWANLGGSGFRGGGSANGKKKGHTTAGRDDFPGLPGGRAVTRTAVSPPPVVDPAGRRVEGRPMNMFAPKVDAAPPPAHPPASSSRDDFPGLPTPAQAPPGLERVDWGTVVESATGGAGKGAKKRNKQKAEKDTLKGMAFGFR